MQLSKIFLSSALVACCFSCAPARAVTLDPETAVGPTILRGGWDIKAWANRLNTVGEAQGLYGDVEANILRIPMFATAHNADGSVDTSAYNTHLEAIQSVLTVNPNVEIFASLKLNGANTFPAWVSQGTTAWPVQNGNIFGNTVQRPNPEHYSTMVADYLSFLKDNGIKVDYFGLNNETDGAIPSDRYIGTYDLLPAKFAERDLTNEHTDFLYVGPDTFGLPAAKQYVSQLASARRLDTIDVVASHYYPQHGSGHESDWFDLAAATRKPLWHTEVHMPGNSAALADVSQTVRDSLSVLFASFRNGVDSFVWWDSGNDVDELRDLVKREVINTTLGTHPIFTSPEYDGKGDPDDEPLYQAFVEGNSAYLWIVNPGDEMTDLPIELESGRMIMNDPTFQAINYNAADNDLGGRDIQVLSATFDADALGFSLNTVPAQSVSIVRFALAEPGDFASDGNINGEDFLAWQRYGLSAAELAEWQSAYGGSSSALLDSFSIVPEPTSLTLIFAAIAVTCSFYRR